VMNRTPGADEAPQPADARSDADAG